MPKAATVITASTVVRGRIEGSEDLDVLGRVTGQVQLTGALFIDEAARVDATIEASSVNIEGTVVGDITATDRVHLRASARVIGDIKAPAVVIDGGAKIRGLVDMGEESAAQPSRASRRQPAAPSTPAEASGDSEDEPELPDAAGAKKVNVKKR